MRRLFVLVVIILAFTVTYGYSHMHEGWQGTTGETQQGQAVAPGYGMMGYGSGGYGMMGQGYGGHMMGGMLGDGTDEEQRKFLDDTADLRREMHGKKFEYSEALRNPDTKRATFLKLKKEMLEIKIKMYEKAIENN